MKGRPKRSAEQVSFDRRMGERLRHFRESRGKDWTQERMAEEIGVNVTAYIKWEQRGPIPPYFIAKISLLFALNPWTLLTGQPSFRQSVEERANGRLGILGLKPSKPHRSSRKRDAA